MKSKVEILSVIAFWIARMANLCDNPDAVEFKGKELGYFLGLPERKRNFIILEVKPHSRRQGDYIDLVWERLRRFLGPPQTLSRSYWYLQTKTFENGKFRSLVDDVFAMLMFSIGLNALISLEELYSRGERRIPLPMSEKDEEFLSQSYRGIPLYLDGSSTTLEYCRKLCEAVRKMASSHPAEEVTWHLRKIDGIEQFMSFAETATEEQLLEVIGVLMQ